MTLLSRRSELVEKIQSVFSDLELGNGTTFSEAKAKDSYVVDEFILTQAREIDPLPKNDWKSLIDAEQLLEILHVFGYLNEKGIRFFLPAVLQSIVGERSDWLLAYNLAIKLCDTDSVAFIPLSKEELVVVKESLQFSLELLGDDSGTLQQAVDSIDRELQ